MSNPIISVRLESLILPEGIAIVPTLCSHPYYPRCSASELGSELEQRCRGAGYSSAKFHSSGLTTDPQYLFKSPRLRLPTPACVLAGYLIAVVSHRLMREEADTMLSRKATFHTETPRGVIHHLKITGGKGISQQLSWVLLKLANFRVADDTPKATAQHVRVGRLTAKWIV